MEFSIPFNLTLLSLVALTLSLDCQEGTKAKYPGVCDKFLECVDKSLRVGNCPIGHKFDVDTKSCQWFWKVNCTDSKTQCVEGSKYSHPFTNFGYLVCTDGKLEPSVCPVLTEFDGEKCSNVEDRSQGLDISVVLRDICIANDLRADRDCTKFQKCINGKSWVTMDCPILQAFDVLTKMCLYQDVATCSETSCIEGDKTAIVNDCHAYYICQGLKKVRKSCAPLSYFDPNENECKLSLTTDCNKILCKDGDRKDGGDGKSYNICSKGKWNKVICDIAYIKEKLKCATCNVNERKPAPNPKNYFECIDGDWTKQKCLLKGTEFSKKLKRCVKVDKKEIIQRSIESLDEDDDACTEGTSRRVEGYCSSFEVCKKQKAGNRKWVKTNCAVKTFYNGQRCVDDRSVCRKYIPILNQCDKFFYGNVTYTCQSGDRFDSLSFFCDQISYAKCYSKHRCNMNHPFDCQKYLTCDSNGHESTQSCSTLNNYNPETRKCEFYWLAWFTDSSFCKRDRFECKDGQGFGVDGDCRHYITCQDSEFKYKSCFWPWRFSNEANSCKWLADCSKNGPMPVTYTRVLKGMKINTVEQQNCKEGSVKADISNCSMFHKCIGGVYTSKSCPQSNKFDVDSNMCVPSSKAKCISSRLVMNAVETCTKGEKSQKIENTCRYYKKCNNDGYWELMKCSPCTNFNAETGQCQFITKEPCPSGVTDPTVPPSFPTPPTPQCKEGARQAVIGDCRSYTECDNGKWELKKCSLWGKFDVNTLQCYIWSFNVKCA